MEIGWFWAGPMGWPQLFQLGSFELRPMVTTVSAAYLKHFEHHVTKLPLSLSCS